MKFIIGTFIVGLFTFLCGCGTGGCVYVYAPGIEILFVDKEGNILYFDGDGGTSFINYDEFYSRLNNIDGKGFLEKCPMEVLSVTDENDIPFEYKLEYVSGVLYRFDFVYHPQGQKREYTYIIKYKIPLISGESVEELRLTLKENKNGHPDGWNGKYNGKSIRIYTMTDLDPDYHNPQRVIDDEEASRLARISKEMLYNGDLVAFDGGRAIYLTLPVDIAP